MRNRSFRLPIPLRVLPVLFVLHPGSGLAQDTSVSALPQSVTPTTAAETSETTPPAAADTIVVTGTRIRRPDYEFPNPIASFDSRSIQLSGRTNLTDFLTQSPALVGSSDSNANAGNNAGIGTTGLNLLNLRNLGEDRTLVLVDGRRHVAAFAGSAAVDVNTIPTDLVERIDIVTGGASAVYGADGVSGVVNFVLKKNFEGLVARGQFDTSGQGDARQRFGSITAGKNFAGGRGNVALNYEYAKDDRLFFTSRSSLRSGNRVAFYQNPDDPNDDPSVPDYVPLRDIRFYDSSRIGGVDVNGDLLPEFLGNGQPFDPGTFVPDFYQQGGSGTPAADYQGDLLPRIERHALNGLFRFELTDKINFFAQGKYVHTRSFSVAQPTFDFYTTINRDNPYLPANIQAAADANTAAGVCDDPDSPDLEACPVLVSRDNFDLGLRGEDITRQTYRGVVGFDGTISDHAKFEVSYVYGRSTAKTRRLGNRFNDRFFASIDAVNDGNGNIVCRSNLDPTALPYENFDSDAPAALSFTPGANSGCVPINPFVDGQNPAAVAFVTTTSVDHSLLTQQVASGSVSGDFGQFFSLPGGDVYFAFGAEWRRETSQSTPAAEDTAGLTFGNVIFPSRGRFNVKEAFGELNAPILRDVPFAHRLSLGAAIRLSDYSTVGKTTTWKLDAVWAPIPDITFRGTYAQAVRAPNIAELFDPAGQDFRSISDPCIASRLNNGSSTRAANCAAILGPLGVGDPATFNNAASASTPGTSGGNPNLDEETARTKTAGIVLQPRFLRGLTAAVDLYDIKLKNAISTPTVTRLAELCVDQPSIDNVFCSQIDRQSGGTNAGRIIGFNRTPQNVAFFRTRGVDFSVNYRFEPAGNIGLFNFRVVGGYLDKLNFIATPGATVTTEAGQSSTTNGGAAPKWVINSDITYTNGGLTLNYGFKYFSKTLRFERTTTAGEEDYVAARYRKIKAKQEHDIQLSFDLNKRLEIYGGVLNLFDQKPDFASDFYPISAVGRSLYVGAKVKLDRLF